jgi:Tol biopolymer transport system component
MKQTICFLTILIMLSACSSGKQKSVNNQPQPSDTIAAETTMKKPADIAYTQCPLAYLVDGELYFYNIDDNKKVKFVEESGAILNFTFDTEGKYLYYNVERDGALWLKLADISGSKVTSQWLADWKLKKDECISETDREMSPLFYYKGDLIIRHNFNWDSYDFNKMAIYSIANKNITQKGFDYDFIIKISGELSFNKAQQYFQTMDENLYYTRNNKKVCLSDKLDFKVLRNKESEEYWVETEFNSYTLSPDETKILYGTMIEMGDLGHGPYSIANANGSSQMILVGTDIAGSKKPVWLKNNNVVFFDNENNLFVANNDDNSVRKIAKNVSGYVAR